MSHITFRSPELLCWPFHCRPPRERPERCRAQPCTSHHPQSQSSGTWAQADRHDCEAAGQNRETKGSELWTGLEESVPEPKLYNWFSFQSLWIKRPGCGAALCGQTSVDQNQQGSYYTPFIVSCVESFRLFFSDLYIWIILHFIVLMKTWF